MTDDHVPTTPSPLPPPPPAGPPPGPLAAKPGSGAIAAAAVAAAVTAGAIYALTAATDRFFVFAFLVAGAIVGWAARRFGGGPVSTPTAVIIGVITVVAMLAAAYFLAVRDDDTLGEFFERNVFGTIMMVGSGIVAAFSARNS